MFARFKHVRLLVMAATTCGFLFSGCEEAVTSAGQGAGAPNPSLQNPINQNAGGQNPIQQAQQLIAQNKFASAENILAQVVQQNPSSGGGWMLLGYARHAQGKLDTALEAHLKAATFAPVKSTGLYNAACVYALKNDSDEAMKYLKQAVNAGFTDSTLLATDPDLVNVRNHDEFDSLLPPILTGDELFAEPTNVLTTLVGQRANDEFGWVARKIGDVDNDGVTDFVTTAPSFNNNAGKVYVYSSRTGSLLFSRVGQANQRLGNGAAAAGDVDADGTPDVIVGGPINGAGIAEVLSGKDGRLLHAFRGQQPGGRFGYKVTGLGDLNGDGHADVAVSALAADGKEQRSGLCRAFSGKDGAVLFELKGESTGDKFGSAIVGSANPEHPILAVGAQDAGPGNRGRVYVYKLEGVEPKLAFTIEADSSAKELGQMFLSFPGDLNADGTPDLFCSDFSDSSGAAGGGRFFVYSCADGEKLLDVKGVQPGEGLGTSISDAGDANGDGIGDLVVGAWQNKEGAPSGGKVYLYSGADGALLTTWTCLQQGDTFGFDAQGIGDVDGDGRVDFLLTSAWSPARGPKTGRVLIIAGPDLSGQE
ncbi:MAG: FG-GAP-like repeat-containing protein [Pirellulales bacterium]|nr:FG-GAP-like repeat-containing protein [Pirellulales bacterium]